MCKAFVRHSTACAALALAAVFATAPPARAQLPSGQSADCSLVSVADASSVLGYAVGDADETLRAGGVCFYGSRSVAEDGDVSYAVVTQASIPARRRFFIAQQRLCGAVAPGAPKAHACGSFAALADAKDVDAYYHARAAAPDARPASDLGRDAVATADGLFVRAPDAVLEIVVRRGSATDPARETDLARLLLARLTRS